MEGLELCYMSAGELAKLVRRQEVSPVEIVDAHLARIEATEPVLNSFITLLPEEARAAAQRAEREIRGGNYRGPLHGIPVGLKDLFHTGGVRTTSGSRIFDTFIPEEDWSVKLKTQYLGVCSEVPQQPVYLLYTYFLTSCVFPVCNKPTHCFY